MGLTRRGWTALTAGLLWSVLAFVVGQRDLLWPGLFLMLLPVASRLTLRAGRLSAERQLASDRVAVAEPVRVELRLRRKRTRPGPIIQVKEELDPGLGWTNWQQPVARSGQESLRLDYEVQPAWRGEHQIGPLDYRVMDLLGLAAVQRPIGTRISILARPPVVALANLPAASGLGRAETSGQLRTGLSGSDDVIVRDYQFGDEVRRIHWRSSAHAGRLMVRREERAWEPNATILIDNRTTSYSQSQPDQRLEWSIGAAASIGVHLQGEHFDLRVVDAAGALVLPTGRGPDPLLDQLARLGTCSATSLRAALEACRQGAEGQLLVALLGQVDPADATCLAESASHGHPGWAILVGGTAGTAAAAQLVADAGWQCVVASPTTSPASAWLEFGGERR